MKKYEILNWLKTNQIYKINNKEVNKARSLHNLILNKLLENEDFKNLYNDVESYTGYPVQQVKALFVDESNNLVCELWSNNQAIDLFRINKELLI